MRVRHATSRTTVTATAAVAVLLGVRLPHRAGAQTAAADGQVTLPVSADWPRGEPVVAAGCTGRAVRRITGGTSGSGMALSKDSSTEELTVHSVSSGTAHRRAYRKEIMPAGLGGQEGIAVSPDGNEIVTAGGVEAS